MYLCVNFCTCVHYPKRPEEVMDPLELEVQAVELPDMGAGNCTLVLCECSMHNKTRERDKMRQTRKAEVRLSLFVDNIIQCTQKTLNILPETS